MKKKNMTVDDVKVRVKEIKETSKMDYGGAHAMEDSLYEDVLRAISKGKCDDPTALAKEALKTNRINFARMCS